MPTNPEHNEQQELYELLRQADRLIQDEDPDEDDFLPDLQDSLQTDPNTVYRNAANGYGAAREESQDEDLPFSINAYNADFHSAPGRLYREPSPKPSRPSEAPVRQTYADNEPPEPKHTHKPRSRHRRHHGCLTTLLILAVLVGGLIFGLHLFIRPPQASANTADRKKNTAAILLCGTDVSGDRTDTMMLLYVDGSAKKAGLLTLPRDTYTKTAYDLEVKLNSAYGRNGGGEEGMAVLMDYVDDLIGYRPDGYILIDLGFMEELIDLMGGVEFDVPQEITFKDKGYGIDVHLQPGLQHLDGRTALGLLRFRFGYYNQDIGRQDVQKQFLKACMDQWFTFDNLKRLPELLKAFRVDTMSTLSTGNYLWFGLNLLRSGFSSLATDTLPGYGSMIGGQSFYVLYPDEVLDLLNEKYNPFTSDIPAGALNICTEP